MADVMSRNKVFSISVSHKRTSFSIVRFEGLRSSSSKIGFLGKSLKLSDLGAKPIKGINPHASSIQMTLSFPKAMKWWKKGLQPNMKEIESAQDLVDSLQQAGNKLVIVDFFSPGCGGCKALHPKICQFAEINPDVMFLQVNYEEHKSMCYSLHVHVLPFFRFYRGANGRLCSFSCTNATIKKFKDALGKHTTERCSLGPAKGLEESELLALAANRDLSFTYTAKPEPVSNPDDMAEKKKLPLVQPSRTSAAQEFKDKSLMATQR